MDALREQLRGRYAIERTLGRGGMGAVYLARDLQLDRLVALKVLPSEFATQTNLRERFVRETRTAASFSHPNIVPVFSIEDHDGLLAFAMGYVEGESVAELVKRTGPLSVRDAVRLLQDVGYALAYAHGRGVVHRDIKPDNIMIERATGRALVMDFGISRTIDTSTIAPGLTRVGEVVGTPEFMSPEQATGDHVDGRSDLYSLGLVVWFALVGELAISGETTHKVLVKQLTEAVPPIAERRGDLPRALVDVVDRCVRKDPAERFATAEALIETLDAAQLGTVDIPLPVRLFAEEASVATMILIGSVAAGTLLLLYLGSIYEGNIDIVLPVVLFGAVVWGRLAQTVHAARRLARRGFAADVIQRGFAGVRAERAAERAQLRADPMVVARRRRVLIPLALLFLFSFAIREYVFRFMRHEIRPDWFAVSLPGAIMLYAAMVIRGVSIVGILSSPLRQSPSELLFRMVWGGAAGRAILRFAARGVATSGGATVTPAEANRVARAPQPHAVAAAPARGATSLEGRVAALERWRKEQEVGQ